MSMQTGLDYEFAGELSDAMTAKLTNVGHVRQVVEWLAATNSFSESCFCKGVVLPIVDAVATRFLSARCGADRHSVFRALRCEGFATPMYKCNAMQVGFSSHSRSNSYHPGSKSGRRAASRRSPDFCIRHPSLRMVGEIKYVPTNASHVVLQIVHELRDYLSINSEPTSDWAHDSGFGLIYDYGGDKPRRVRVITDYWESDGIFLITFCGG